MRTAQHRRIPICLLATLLLALACHAAPVRVSAAAIAVADVPHQGPVDFEKEILPVLRRNCLACHNATDAEADLVLETPASILKGGENGPAAVVGRSAASLILKHASHQTDPVMPPEDNDVGATNLSPEQLGLLKLWIDQGAKGELTGSSAPIIWQPLPATVHPVYALDVSPHGQYVAAGRANQIWIYSVPARQVVTRLSDPALVAKQIYQGRGVAHLDLVQSLAFSPDGQWLASGGYRSVKLWQRPINPQKGQLAGIEGEPQSLAVSPDGRWAAIGQAGGKVKLLDIAVGKVEKTIEGHSAAVTAVAFSADGTLLATGSQDKTFRVVRLADGQALGTIETPAPIDAIAIVLDNKQVATGHADNKLLTWHLPGTQPPPAEGQEPAPPAPLKDFTGHGGAVTSLVSVAGGTQLLSGSSDGTMRLWDANSGNMLRQFSHGGPITAIAVSPDGQKVASASSNNTAKIFRFDNAQQIAELRGDRRLRLAAEDAARAVALAQRHVENAGQDLDQANQRKKSEEENAKQADEKKNKAADELKKKEEAAQKPLEEQEQAQQELAAIMPEFEKSEAEKEQAAQNLEGAQAAVKAAQNKLKSAGDDQAQKDAAQQDLEQANKKQQEAQDVVNEANKKFEELKKNFQQAENNVKQKSGPAEKALEERTAARRAVEAAERSIVRSTKAIKQLTDALPGYEAAHQELQAAAAQRASEKQQADEAIAVGDQPLLAIAFAADGALVATAGEDGLVHLWGSQTGAGQEVFAGQNVPITALAATPEGGLLALGKSGPGIIWDVAAEWKLARTIGSPDSAEQFADRVTALHFSPDSSLLATGGGQPSRSGELKIWKVDDGSLVREITDAHSDTIFDIAFSPDGQQIASCAADRFARIHKVSGELVRTLEGHTRHVMGVAWRADGRVLATGGSDQSVNVWNALTGERMNSIGGWKRDVTAVKFVSTSDDMLTAAGDPLVSLRDTKGGNKGTYGGTRDFIYTARVSADGKTIAAGGQDGIVHVWNEQKQPIAKFELSKPEASSR